MTAQIYPLTASQPPATQALQAAAPPAINPEALRSLGAMLASKFTQYESERRLAEMKWIRNARQFLGIYDVDIDKQIDNNRSRAYPKLTRVKCVSMLARLMNLLFPEGEKNWAVSESKVPNLDQQDLQNILDQLMPPGGQPPDDAKIEEAIRQFARKRACRLELEIEDQLQELGGNKGNDYVALCRRVLMSGIQYGCGVLRGPFVEEETERTWQVADGALTALDRTAYKPRFEWVPLWDYYPDLGAKYFGQMDGQFLRVVLSKHQVVKLMKRADFMEDKLQDFLKSVPTGNYRRRAFETELRSLGVQVNTASSELTKYEALVWEGYVPGAMLAQCGANVPDDKLSDDVRAEVWMFNGQVVKADIDPWTTLIPGREVPRYHHFIFEEDESFMLGNGLPNIVRDSALGLAAATRMMIDNASVQRVLEVNYSMLRPDQDIKSIEPDMVIAREDDSPATAQYPAVRVVDLPMKVPEIKQIADMFLGFADLETFINPATGGDMQKGPSEPFRTAAGASMLRGDAALPFKDVVRNFDRFTESVIGSIIAFNRAFNPKEQIKGDFNALARGATSLIAKEVLGIHLDQLAQTLTDEEKPYLNARELLRARLRVRDMDYEDIVYDDAKCDEIDQQRQQQQQLEQQQQNQTVQATVRKLLSDALKNIAQAGKNAASAEATTANVILTALEKGLNPDMLAPSQTAQGAGDDAGNTPGEQTPAPDQGGAGAGGAAGQPGDGGISSLEAVAGAAAGGGGSRFAAMPGG